MNKNKYYYKENNGLAVEKSDIRLTLHSFNDEPAITIYDKDQIYLQEWYLDGKLHRSFGPAVIWHTNGKLIKEKYFNYGKCHRLDGPAEIIYREDGSIVTLSWSIEGRSI